MGIYTNRLHCYIFGISILLNIASNAIVAYTSKVHGRTPTITQVQQCIPVISEGIHSKLEVAGHVYLECDFEECGKIYRIIYEKNITTWVAVFEGVNEQVHNALETGLAYSLKRRTGYAPFFTQHTLCINPLILEDQGEWRCVAHDTNGNNVVSKAMKLKFAPICIPEISEGRSGKHEIDGHTSFECDISTCGSFTSIHFDKIYTGDTWETVYVANKTINHALYTRTNGYSLVNRTVYVAFTTRHILYIKSLKSKDRGKWRCIVFHHGDIQAHSNTIELYIDSPFEDPMRTMPDIKVVFSNNTFKYSCEIENIVFEPIVVWVLNGLELEAGEDFVFSHDNDLWSVKSLLELPIDEAKKSRIDCEIKTKGTTYAWTKNSITVDIEDVLKEYPKAKPVCEQCTDRRPFIAMIVMLTVAFFLLLFALYRFMLFIRKRYCQRPTQQNSETTNLMPESDSTRNRPDTRTLATV